MLNKIEKFCALVATLTFAIISANQPAAAQQDLDTLKSDLLLGLMQPLPITLIGPLVVADVDVRTSDDNRISVQLPNASIMGLIPLGDLSLKLSPLSGDRYRVSDLQLPEEINVGPITVRLGENNLFGVWNNATRSYDGVRFTLDGLSVSLQESEMARLDSLSLSIDQQGKLNVEQSRLSLTGEGLKAQLPDPGPIEAARFHLSMQAQADEPLDLHALITQSVQSTLMAPDQSKLLDLLTYLRARQFQDVDVVLSLDEASIAESGGDLSEMGRVNKASLTLKGNNLSEALLGNLALTFAGEGAALNPDEGTEMRAQTVNARATVEALALSAVVDSIAKVQAALSGNQVSGTMADLYDAFLGFGSLEISSSGSDIVFKDNSRYSDYAEIGFDRGSLTYGLGGFGDGQGAIDIRSALSNFRFELPQIRTTDEEYDSDAGDWKEVAKSDDQLRREQEEQEQLRRVLKLALPQNGTLRSSATGFGDKMIRRILSKLPIDENLLTNLLALGAVVPTLEIDTVGHLNLQSEMTGLSTTFDATMVPMRMLSVSPYTGTQRVEIRNWDATLEEVRDLSRDVDEDGEILMVMNPIFAALDAMSVEEGENRVWDFEMDGERDYVVINGQRYYLGILSSLSSMQPLMMMGMMGRF